MEKHQHNERVVEASAANRIDALDLLRLLAVLMVFAFHFGFRGPAIGGVNAVAVPGIAGIAKYGYLGVQLFFVISGFVIAYSMQGRTALEFAAARFVRIYPGFVLCMTLTAIVVYQTGSPLLPMSMQEWLANLFIAAPLFKQPYVDGVYWSLVCEIMFYVWMTLILSFDQLRRRIPSMLVLWLLVSMCNELVIHSPLLRRALVTDQSGFFAAGCLLYEFYRGRRGARMQALFAASIGCAVIQAEINARILTNWTGVGLNSGIVAAICVASAFAVYAATQLKIVPLPKYLIAAIGGLTYPFYLLHLDLGYSAFYLLGGPARPQLTVLVILVSMLAISVGFWWFAERPAQRLVKSWLAQATKPATSGAQRLQRVPE